MRIRSKVRFTAFICILMVLSMLFGYTLGSKVFGETYDADVKPVSETVDVVQMVDLGEYTLTAYCGCKKCCGKWASVPVVGAGGVELKEGVHVASPLPFGTTVMIEGLGMYEVQDRTARWVAKKYNNKIIDIYFESHSDALKFGKQKRNVKQVV